MLAYMCSCMENTGAEDVKRRRGKEALLSACWAWLESLFLRNVELNIDEECRVLAGVADFQGNEVFR